MSTRHIRKIYSTVPFETAETQLCQELQAYFEAIHSYPERFAKAPVSFQEHLLNVICSAGTASRADQHERREAAS
jgi:hypothetical protein